jgi:hypothetical protein
MAADTLTQDDVVAALGRERPLSGGSAPWTIRFIDLADRQFGGRWHRVTLSGTEAGAIILPPHAGEPCKGDRLPLVEPGGATVLEAGRRLAGIRADYEFLNQSCWGRIAGASREPFSTLLLTVSPLEAEDYRTLAPGAGRLFHLDGFHRLVGWAWAGRLTAEARIAALVAGDGVAWR